MGKSMYPPSHIEMCLIHKNARHFNPIRPIGLIGHISPKIQNALFTIYLFPIFLNPPFNDELSSREKTIHESQPITNSTHPIPRIIKNAPSVPNASNKKIVQNAPNKNPVPAVRPDPHCPTNSQKH
jgi:hypothetical protein